MRFRAFWIDLDTLFFFENFREPEAQNACKRSEQDAWANMLRQTVTLAKAIFLFISFRNYLLFYVFDVTGSYGAGISIVSEGQELQDMQRIEHIVGTHIQLLPSKYILFF